eukprot:302308_1
MTTEYESVRERAKQEVVFNQIESTFDLSNRSRLMPPPLVIIVVIFSSIVWVFNFILSAIIHPKLNVCAYLHYDTFKVLRSRQLKKRCFYEIIITIILWIVFIVGISIYKPISIWVAIGAAALLVCFAMIYMFGQFIYNTCCCCCENESKIFATKYVESMSRCQLWRWYCSSNCCRNKKKKSHDLDENDEMDADEMSDKNGARKIHHKGCYAEIILRSQDANKSLNPIQGITMSKYIELYEKAHNEINPTDKSLIKMLTRDTLFCKKCYRHLDKKNIDRQLVTSWEALLDYSSVMTFIFIPIAYIPLLIIFLFMTLVDCIIKKCKERETSEQDYTNQNFDADYFPRKDNV